jgi:hypothetical protein
MKASSSNIVRHPKMHMYAQYGHIITNYATILAITLVVRRESHETSHMIAHFWGSFLRYSKFHISQEFSGVSISIQASEFVGVFAQAQLESNPYILHKIP